MARPAAAAPPKKQAATLDPFLAPRLYQARFKDVWSFFKSQSFSFWLVCLYVFLEYVRPQDIGFGMQGLPLPFWTIMLCLGAFLLEGARFRTWTLGDTALSLFSAIVIASSMTAVYPDYARGEWNLYFSWVIIYFLITNIVNSEKRLFVFMLLYLVFCMKMTQHGMRNFVMSGFSFVAIGTGCAPSWFQNSGECGIQMAMLLPVSAYFLLALRPLWTKRKYLIYFGVLPVGAAITITASSSRGAMLAMGGLAIWFVLKTRSRVKTLTIVAVSAVTIWFITPPEFKTRFTEMGNDGDSVARLTYWKAGLAMVKQRPVLGIGYRNWLPYYRSCCDPKGELPHNIFIEAAAEMGYVGFLGFVGLILATFIMNWQTRRKAKKIPDTGPWLASMAHGFDGALVGFLISGFFVTVLYYPFFWINLAMTVSLCCVTKKRALAQRNRQPVVLVPPPSFIPPMPSSSAT